jgi:hypothetical protein
LLSSVSIKLICSIEHKEVGRCWHWALIVRAWKICLYQISRVDHTLCLCVIGKLLGRGLWRCIAALEDETGQFSCFVLPPHPTLTPVTCIRAVGETCPVGRLFCACRLRWGNDICLCILSPKLLNTFGWIGLRNLHCVHFEFTFSLFWSPVGGTRWRRRLRFCATSRKVAGSIPEGVIGICSLT